MLSDIIRIEELRSVEQGILDVFSNICDTNDLKYSLAYGTLLGAVRHHGFIPWDDDIDVMMPREDYDKLIEIWHSQAPKEYILDCCFLWNDSVNNFVKIRKDNTTFIPSEAEKRRSFHKGIYIDVFPGDRVAQTYVAKRIQFLFFSLNLLFNRGYGSGKKGAIGLVEKMLLYAVPKGSQKAVSDFFGRKSRQWNWDKDAPIVFPCTIECCRHYYPSNLFLNLQKIGFEGKTYFAVRDYDTALRIEYGDYMRLPPLEERVWKHHPILIDFEHNYEDLVEKGTT